ncbi:MAG: hypothetical protein FWE18_05150 [Alphaproteobacteria bacterium]|nr:hypothetical protein [Alphaproteobacteria bacterium]
MRFLKSLFLKESRNKIPELAKDFVKRRYYQTDSEVYRLNVPERDTSHEKLTEIYISDIRNVTKEKTSEIKQLLSAYGADSDFDFFVEKNSKEYVPLPKKEPKKRTKKQPKQIEEVDNSYEEQYEEVEELPEVVQPRNKRIDGSKVKTYDDSYDYALQKSSSRGKKYTKSENLQPVKRKVSDGRKVRAYADQDVSSKKKAKNYEAQDLQNSSYKHQHNNTGYAKNYMEDSFISKSKNLPKNPNNKKKDRSYTLDDFKNDFADDDDDINEFLNMDKNTRKSFEEMSRNFLKELDD